MMTEERVRQYDAKLKDDLKDIIYEDMANLSGENYDLMGVRDCEFWAKVEILKTLKYILDH